MKKGSFSFRNIYRVLIANPGKSGRMLNISQESLETDRRIDHFFRKVVKDDQLTFNAGRELEVMLKQRMINKRKPSLSENSFADTIFPLFSLQHIELKMAAVTIMMAISLTTGPVGIHSVNRTISPSFLADTLIDSSGFAYSEQYDTVLSQP